MENEEKDIIRQLAGKLRESEMPYRQGAWERFQAMQMQAGANAAGGSDSGLATEAQPWPPTADLRVPLRASKGTGARVRSLLRPLIGIAAILILAFGAIWWFMGSQNQSQNQNQKSNSSGQVARQAQPESQSQTQQTRDQITNNLNKQDNNPSAIAAIKSSAAQGQVAFNQPGAGSVQQPATGFRFSFPYIIKNSGIIRFNHGNSFRQSDKDAARIIASDALASINTIEQRSVPGLRISPVGPVYTLDNQGAVAQVQSQLPSQSSLERAPAAKNNAVTLQKPQSVTASNNESYFDDKGYIDLSNDVPNNKWNMGVMVVPAVSNDAKLNMGYGLSVGYRLSNRLSINSGVAYTELTGSRNADQQSTIASGGRTLSSIDATATGLNVPLELRYHISKKLYVGTGVAAMAVLSDKVERKYAIAEMQTSAFEARNGQPLKPDAMQSIASNIQTKETIPEDQIGSKDFAGFINFSFGFKQPLNKSKSLSIEPFISVPMSNHLFNQNIKMTDGGLRIKLGL